MKPPLWQHQRIGIDLLCERPANMLAYDMGTGKSRTVIEAIQDLKLHRVLVAAPKTVCDVWPEQFALWHDSMNVCLLNRGALRTRMFELFHACDRGLPTAVIVNYDALHGELGDDLEEYGWDIIVADESHTIKSASAQRSRWFSKIYRKTKRRVCLSGTPMPHSPLDVYGQYRFLDPGIYGLNYQAFRHRYTVFVDPEQRKKEANEPKRMLPWSPPPPPSYVACYAGETEDALRVVEGSPRNKKAFKIPVGFKDLDHLSAKFHRLAHVVRKADVLDLPPRIVEHRIVQLGPEARRVYTALRESLKAKIADGTITVNNCLTQLLRLQQITGGIVALDAGGVRRVDDVKRAALRELFDDVARPEHVVVFARFRADLDAIAEAAVQSLRPCYELSGRHAADLDVWRTHPGAVLAAQIQTGGQGIDLTASAYAVYYSVGFSLAEYEQSAARLDRPGQTRSVTYTHLIAEDTIDEVIYRAIDKRRDLVASIIDGLHRGRDHLGPDREEVDQGGDAESATQPSRLFV